MSNISFNPAVTTNATGSFNVSSDGYTVGVCQPDPAVRFQLAGGVLGVNETLPMFGGVGICEGLDGANSVAPQLGPTITRATTLTAAAAGVLTGFSVFDQNYSGIQTPQSPVPVVGSGGAVHFVRLGSLARVPLAISSGLAETLSGGALSTTPVAWDFVNQQLVPVETTFSAATISGATWASTSGGQAVFTVGTNLTSNLSPGDDVIVASVVPSGYNGTWSVLAVTSTTVTVSLPASVTPGAYSSGGTLGPVSAGLSLPIKLLDVNVGNSMAPLYTPSTGFVTWNRSANAALCLI